MSPKQRDAVPTPPRPKPPRSRTVARVRQRRPDLRIAGTPPTPTDSSVASPIHSPRDRRLDPRSAVVLAPPRPAMSPVNANLPPRERHHDARHERAFEPDVTRRAYRRVRRDGGDLVVRMSERGVVARSSRASTMRADDARSRAERRKSGSRRPNPCTGGVRRRRGRETRRIRPRVLARAIGRFSRAGATWFGIYNVGIRARETSVVFDVWRRESVSRGGGGTARRMSNRRSNGRGRGLTGRSSPFASTIARHRAVRATDHRYNTSSIRRAYARVRRPSREPWRCPTNFTDGLKAGNRRWRSRIRSSLDASAQRVVCRQEDPDARRF